MNYRTLGSTGIEVSEIGFGAWAIGGTASLGDIVTGWGDTDDDESMAALSAAFDAGVTFFDTADVYGMGHSERLIGELFGHRRDSIVIASKGGNKVVDGTWVKDYSATFIRHAIDASLKRLRTDYIDVYFLHTPRTDEQMRESFATLEALERLREEGILRCAGISVAHESQGIRMIQSGVGQAIQAVHNILEPAPERELFPLAKEHGVGIVARVPLASGFLTGKFTRDTRFPDNDHRSWAYPPEKTAETVDIVERLKFLTDEGRTMPQAALQYVLSMNAVSSVIPGAKNPVQAVENARASDLGTMTPEELSRIRDIVPQD